MSEPEGPEEGSRLGDPSGTKRVYSQLLSLHERILIRLRLARDDLEAPTTQQLVRQLQSRTGSPVAEHVGQLTQAVEDALRAVQVCQSELQKELVEARKATAVESVPNLPPVLRRFLAERSESAGFRYEILQDPIRGWIIRWKEYTDRGTVRGRGQFYERPYAWIDE